MAAEAERITRELKASRDLAAQNVKTLQDKLASPARRSNQADLAQVSCGSSRARPKPHAPSSTISSSARRRPRN